MSVRKRVWTTRGGEEKTGWLVDYFDQAGNRHVEQFQRKAEAKERAAKVHVDIGKGIHVPLNARLTVAEAAKNWINDKSNRERSTRVQYQRHVDLHILPRLGKVPLAKLTNQHVKAFRDSLLNGSDDNLALKKLTPVLARKVLTSFKSLLKAANYGHVTANVSVELERAKREHRLHAGVDFPDPTEVKRIINAAKTPKQRALLMTVALTGLRASELRGLRWTDVNVKTGVLDVRQRADLFGKIGPPKTKAGTRTIPLPPELVRALKDWQRVCPRAKGQAQEYVFPTSTGAIQHHSDMLHRLVGPVMLAAGVVKHGEDGSVKPKYALHAFRHFFASWCINAKAKDGSGGRGLPPKQVQHLMGHSSIVITLDIYGHLFPDNGDRKELAESTKALLGVTQGARGAGRTRRAHRQSARQRHPAG
jgi:integrase